MSAKLIYSMNIKDDGFDFDSSIATAIQNAEIELDTLNEIINSLQNLKPECDKLDYALAASSGALCGVMDIFLVRKPNNPSKPNESPIGTITDQWFEERTKDFARMCGWEGDSLSSALECLERKFDIPYDQTGLDEIGKKVKDLNPRNHHFKSLAHNPTLLGLFFSILDQFTHESHFVTNGDVVPPLNYKGNFNLKGNDIPSKLFCGFVNWFGHLISDMSGSSNSKTRGMGIPSPLWSWTNDLIVLRRTLNIPVNEFDQSLNELAINIYNEGFDMRFQTAQMIPVFMNDVITRFLYSIRRMYDYFRNTPKEDRSFQLLWHKCEPFTNPTVKRMLTVAHGTFCLIDISDATIRSNTTGVFNPTEFFLRLNIIGVGRFTISLYGEGHRVIQYHNAYKQAQFATQEKLIVEDYMKGLKTLSMMYNDKDLLLFIDDFKNSNAYQTAFNKTVTLAKLRKVPEEKILKSKNDIDNYFMVKKGDNNG